MSTSVFKAFFLIAITILLLSCKKDRSVEQPGTPSFKIVKKVFASPSDQIQYEYNTDGNVSRYISQWQDAAGTIRTQTNVFEYNASRQLVKWSNEGGYGLYTYKNGLPEQSEHFSSNGRKIATLTYAFDASKKLVSLLENIADPAPDGPKQTRISYQYYSTGNLSRMDFAYRKELSDPFTVDFSKKFVQYDDKKNPEPDGVSGAFLPGVTLLYNNPVRIDNLRPDGTVEGYTRYEYTYNQDGFPLQRKQFIAVNNVEHPPIVFSYAY